jgi:hypothetical protein
VDSIDWTHGKPHRPGFRYTNGDDQYSLVADRINSVRGHFGVPLFNFTDADLAGALVTTTHFLELRSALQDAYVAAGQAAPTYTDPVLTPQLTFIKAAHINELCVAVAFLE